jgi:hypothetical protein
LMVEIVPTGPTTAGVSAGDEVIITQPYGPVHRLHRVVT